MKTNYIIFKDRRKIHLVDDSQCIHIGRPSVQLGQVKKTKYLDVIINSSLSWEDRIKLNLTK